MSEKENIGEKTRRALDNMEHGISSVVQSLADQPETARQVVLRETQEQITRLDQEDAAHRKAEEVKARRKAEEAEAQAEEAVRQQHQAAEYQRYLQRQYVSLVGRKTELQAQQRGKNDDQFMDLLLTFGVTYLLASFLKATEPPKTYQKGHRR